MLHRFWPRGCFTLLLLLPLLALLLVCIVRAYIYPVTHIHSSIACVLRLQRLSGSRGIPPFCLREAACRA